MAHDTIVILGIPIDNLTMDEAIERILGLIEAYGQNGRISVYNIIYFTKNTHCKKIRAQSHWYPQIIFLM